jgi:hypothetical protein
MRFKISGEDLENMFMNNVLEKTTLIKHRFEKSFVYASLCGYGLKKFQFEPLQMTTYNS